VLGNHDLVGASVNLSWCTVDALPFQLVRHGNRLRRLLRPQIRRGTTISTHGVIVMLA
jgi:hypothetical protein